MSNLYIFSAPSGAGKTSLVNSLAESTRDIIISISCTTRPMRPGEEQGVHYDFIDETRFLTLLDEGDFLEYARVFDNYYGTSRKRVQERLDGGLDVILEIDWQGARQVREKIPASVSIFILPPSRQELRRRLHGRGQDSDGVIARRMRDAQVEMSHFQEFDYLVVNDDFHTALEELKAIVQARRLKKQDQIRRYATLLMDLRLLEQE